MFPKWWFSSRSGLEPNRKHCNGFYHMKNRDLLNQWLFGRFHIFTNSELWLQWSIWVLIVSQDDKYLRDAVLDALSPHILQFVIQSLLVELLWNNVNYWVFFKVTQWILIGSQIEEWEVKKHLTLHLLHRYHIVIRSKLKSLFGAKDLSLQK